MATCTSSKFFSFRVSFRVDNYNFVDCTYVNVIKDKCDFDCKLLVER